MSLIAWLHRRFVFLRRIRVLAALLAEMLPSDAKILDVGCGDGLLARRIAERRPDVAISGIDVMLRPESHVAVAQFNGSTIPFEDDSFDVVMFIDVLHHTDDPEALLREARRVARRAVLLKDHTRDGVLAGPTLRFMDWFGNAPQGVVLPYNFWPEGRWREAFEHVGLIPTAWNSRLHIYPAPGSWFFDRSLHFIARLEFA